MSGNLADMQIWFAPILLALLTAVGLLSALLGDGFWDMLSWLALGAPVAVVIWFVAKPTPRTLIAVVNSNHLGGLNVFHAGRIDSLKATIHLSAPLVDSGHGVRKNRAQVMKQGERVGVSCPPRRGPTAKCRFTAMRAHRAYLSDTDIWELVLYIRTLQQDH